MLCLSTLVLVLDNGVLNVAIPVLTEDLGATAQEIQWIVASYILVFAGLLLSAGSLSDRYGRKKVMIAGLAIFGVASLVATYADSPELLITGRVLMGTPEAARGSIGEALAVAGSTGDNGLAQFAKTAFAEAMPGTFVASAIGVLGAAVLAFVLMRDKLPADTTEGDTVDEVHSAV